MSETLPELGFVEKGKIEAIRTLTDSEYQEFIKAGSHLRKFSSDYQIYRMARSNYYDFRNLLKRYLQQFRANPSMNYGRMEDMAFEINRYLLNYLASARTFLDHSEYNLKKRHGENSERVEAFKRACKEIYDNCFSYRFLYKLRNYAQHCGLPISSLNLTSKLDKANKIRYSLVIKFNRDELLSKYTEWGRQLTREIGQLPPEFDITPYVDEMMKCLGEICLKMLKNDLVKAKKSAEFMEKLIEQVKTKTASGMPCILSPQDIKRSTDRKVVNLKMNVMWFPINHIELVNRIYARA